MNVECVCVCVCVCVCMCMSHLNAMGWLRLVGSLKLYVSFAEYSLFCRALWQKRPMVLRSLLIAAAPYYRQFSECLHIHIWIHIHIRTYIHIYVYMKCMNVHIGILARWVFTQVSIYMLPKLNGLSRSHTIWSTTQSVPTQSVPTQSGLTQCGLTQSQWMAATSNLPKHAST